MTFISITLILVAKHNMFNNITDQNWAHLCYASVTTKTATAPPPTSIDHTPAPATMFHLRVYERGHLFSWVPCLAWKTKKQLIRLFFVSRLSISLHASHIHSVSIMQNVYELRSRYAHHTAHVVIYTILT